MDSEDQSQKFTLSLWLRCELKKLNLILLLLFCPENVVCSISAACIQVHFILDLIMESINMNPDHLDPYCLKYRLLSTYQMREQTTKVMTCELRVYWYPSLSCGPFYFSSPVAILEVIFLRHPLF